LHLLSEKNEIHSFHPDEVPEFQFVDTMLALDEQFFRRGRNIFSGKDGSGPLEKLGLTQYVYIYFTSVADDISAFCT